MDQSTSFHWMLGIFAEQGRVIFADSLSSCWLPICSPVLFLGFHWKSLVSGRGHNRRRETEKLFSSRFQSFRCYSLLCLSPCSKQSFTTIVSSVTFRYNLNLFTIIHSITEPRHKKYTASLVSYALLSTFTIAFCLYVLYYVAHCFFRLCNPVSFLVGLMCFILSFCIVLNVVTCLKGQWDWQTRIYR